MFLKIEGAYLSIWNCICDDPKMLKTKIEKRKCDKVSSAKKRYEKMGNDEEKRAARFLLRLKDD